MKKILFLSLIISSIIVSCTQEKKSPIEGTWKLILGNPKLDDDTSFQTMVKWGQIKTWSKEYFTFVGHYDQDTISFDVFGGGTYTLNGDKYEEHVIYHNDKSYIGTKYKCILEIRNDTLFQKCRMDNNWKLQEDYGTEKYIRLK